MSRALPRTNFNSSRLVRLLADLAVANVAESKQAFAERLGEWLGVAEAITVYSALNASAASAPAAGSGAPALSSTAVEEEFARARTALVDSIAADGVLNPGQARVKLPMPESGASIESAADFSPYRRYYLTHQRDMDSSIGRLRADVRAALSRHSPRLRQIAALDAALDKALSVREQSLLASVPALLEKRFEHLRKAHQAALVETPTADDPARWMQPGGWLAVFGRDLRGVLLAELDVRLQPVVGLIEALGSARREAAPFPPPEGVKKTRGGPSFS